ncbi:atpase [Anaeramoeba ignava]|uniref:Atpase n=1 Tax=Anaeramoeba ignava TaxID=1746090 RepID=A0A9Q0LHK2_ANAIG|nr:atpase [Anaeramoeba ignava]
MDISQWISEEKIHEKKTVKTKNIEQTAQDKQAQEQQSFPDLKPYANDFEYLEDRFEMYANKLNLIQEKENESQTFYIDSVFHSQALVREFSAKDHSLRTKCEQRLKLTEKNGEWIPRMERLAESRKLTEFEKNVVLFLIGIKTSQKMLAVLNWRQVTVEMLLKMFCKNLKEQVMNRKYFYKSGSLVRDRIIQFSGSMLESSLNSMEVFVDRRMVDFVLGLDTEMEELIEGSHLYTSTVKMDHVVLREEDKRLVLKTVTNYDHFAKCRKRLGLDDAIANSGGLVLLFYGESGTGKTMMANALGNELGRKIMLINFPTLGKNTAGEIIQYIFREANLHNALLFFDECEGIFESRQKGQYNVNLLLTEIEKFDGIIVLATNRAFDLDEAMHRRIALALEFKKPDPLLRQQIWDAHLPKSIRYDSSVDLKALALKFELTGGFIKNAVLSALSIAVSRDGLENVTITQEDLERGAKLQLRAKLRMTDFHRRIVPQRGLSTLVLPPKTLQLVREIIDAEKSRLVLDSWGFDTSIGFQAGSTVLLCGPPGTGKTLATEAIAYEIGRPLKVINAAELVSKYVGQTSKNIDLLFTEAKNNDSVLVFDEAEGLFGTRHSAQKSSTDRYANIDVGLLLYHMEKFNGIVILCSNLVSAIDPAFFRRMRFVVDFPMPDQGLREILWKKLIPDSAPVLSDSIQFKLLASSFEFSGGNIHNSIIRAASKVALRPRDSQTITTDDLFQAAQKELEKISKNIDKNQSYIK